MNRCILILIAAFCLTLQAKAAEPWQSRAQLAGLTPRQEIKGFRVVNLYGDENGRIVGARLLHIRTAAPVFLLQIETVPKAFIWVDTPDRSDRGVPHALEHVLAEKGTKGRYVTLLTNMRLSQSVAATYQDFNFYSFSSGTGMEGFLEQLHAWLDALFNADFTNVEAERELYHFGISSSGAAKERALVEEGSVYEECITGQSTETYYFELNKRLLGNKNPFSSDIRGLPDSMRSVTAQDIRQFYEEHYRLGPTTGFIFTIPPQKDVQAFLERVSNEFDGFAKNGKQRSAPTPPSEPKYPIATSQDTSVGIYPFPSGRETDAAAIRLGWKPVRADSSADLKLLQLFFRGLAADQNSVLYKALVDRKAQEIDSGARKVDYDVFVQNSPWFPFEQIEISGIPSNRISVEQIEHVRNVVLNKIRNISEYEDKSPQLKSFNTLIASYAKAWQRSQAIWIKTPPPFGTDLSRDWKAHFAALEMDPSFTKSLAEEQTWQFVEQQLRSGRNIWRRLISAFHLLDPPYAMASAASPQLLDTIEQAKQNRAHQKVTALEQQYRTNDEQEALARFEHDELEKTKEIDGIQSKVRRPQFTNHPPLTADDEIRYQQFRIADVPVVASIFERPPTIDIGLAFDLRKIPRRYYKYLPVLPKCFDSLGLKNGEQVVSYSELVAQIQEKTLKLSVGYEQNATSKRADLAFRASISNAEEFRTALKLMSDILRFSHVDLSAVERLRDVVAQRLTVDDSFRKDEFRSMQNAAYSFLTQQDALFQAVNSAFTRTHWDERLRWQLHEPASEVEIEKLGKFAGEVLSQPTGISASEISRQLKRPDLNSLEKDLLEYWDRSLASFPEIESTEGLRRLTLEVQEDLRKGPAQTIAEIEELRALVVNRQALHLDVVIDAETLDQMRPDLASLVEAVPLVPLKEVDSADGQFADSPIMAKLAQRYHFVERNFPWQVGLVNRDSLTGNMVFYADLPGYAQLDHGSLIQILSSKIFAGNGPQSLYIKTRESGLAYAMTFTSNPAFKLLWDYADRSSNPAAVVALWNNVALGASDLKDPLIVDYALRQTFAIPRSMYAPSTRGVAIAQDLRDGNDPETVRRFSEAILALRQDPHLFSELTRAAVNSICGVLLDERCKQQHKASHSIFFFVGPEKILSETEKGLAIPRLLRVYPSDFWIGDDLLLPSPSRRAGGHAIDFQSPEK